jgi:DNA-binding transcriptional ArsR family regulator
MSGNVVYNALADDHRRELLDRLRRQPGQTLTQLCSRMPMSRQAVTKHLTVLRQAGLVDVRRQGRTMIHTLNPHPLRDVDVWLRDYAALWDDRLASLRTHLEENP